MKWQSYFSVPLMTMPEWAEDALDRLVYASNERGRWQVYAWDRDSGSRRQVSHERQGARHARIFPDGEMVCWFADPDGTEVGRWMVQPFGGGVDRPLRAAAPPGWRTGLVVGPGGRWATGSTTSDGCTIEVGRIGHGARVLYRNEKPVAPASLSRDGQLLAIAHPGKGHLARPTLQVFDVETAELVSELSDGTEHGLIGARFSRRPGDQRLAFLHERNDLMRPGVWDPLSGARTDLELDLPGDVEIVDWHPDGDRLVIVHSHHGRDEAYLVDADGGRAHRIPHDPGTITDIGVRPDGQIWLRRTSGGTPPRLECTMTGPLMPTPATGGSVAGHEYQPWRFRNEPGDWVHGFLALPAGGGPHPTVMLVHGGPHHHDADSWNPRVQVLVDAGWAVAMVNYQGSTGRGKGWLDRGVGSPGWPQVSDIIAARRALIERGISDPRRIVLGGGSWGGYLTLLAIGLAPDGWQAAVAIAPLADLMVAYRDQSPHIRHLLEMLFTGSPDEKPVLYRDCSPTSYVDRVRTPLLILAGENDSRCPRSQIDSYVACLRRAGGEVELATYGSGHNSLDAGEQQDQMRRILAFLNRAKHPGGPSSPTPRADAVQPEGRLGAPSARPRTVPPNSSSIP